MRRPIWSIPNEWCPRFIPPTTNPCTVVFGRTFDVRFRLARRGTCRSCTWCRCCILPLDLPFWAFGIKDRKLPRRYWTLLAGYAGIPSDMEQFHSELSALKRLMVSFARRGTSCGARDLYYYGTMAVSILFSLPTYVAYIHTVGSFSATQRPLSTLCVSYIQHLQHQSAVPSGPRSPPQCCVETEVFTNFPFASPQSRMRTTITAAAPMFWVYIWSPPG